MSTADGSRAPEVSIVLPTYKRAALLGPAIANVLAQSFTDLELIVVDDGSPDETPQVVSRFDDPRLRYVRNNPNLKLPRSLNRGHELARGRYLTWTSDDNLYAPDAIARMVQRLRRGDCDLVWADHWLFSHTDAAGQPLDLQRERLPDRVQLERGNHMGACFLYTRALWEAVGGYDPELFLVEDYDFFIRASRRFGFAHLDEALYFFRRDEQTLYFSRFPEVKASDALVRFHNGLLDEHGVQEMLVGLLVRQPEGLCDPWLRWTHRAAHGRSWRLQQWQRRLAERHVRRRLQPGLHQILQGYGHRSTRFGEARDALKALLAGIGRLQPAPVAATAAPETPATPGLAAQAPQPAHAAPAARSAPTVRPVASAPPTRH